ncbi:hypothetical protein F2Q70_00021770 [Brassica cretica]|uniref:Uncharacterized protein n=2 Tax=Brassica cretica TaxID=69181 RepID=A0A8S9GKY7_BRACR|nr:hypothetical protein F2Q70_00021770 [Brassica cretica]KAF2557150.1 hypothetical protein F2Q68_00015470 [Brassica cretica]KAF3608095.1 hypothetical protein DY000_02048101 [Brassica cretica]
MKAGQIQNISNAFWICPFSDIFQTREDFMPEIDRVKFQREERSVSEDGGLHDPVHEVGLGASSSRFWRSSERDSIIARSPSPLR